MARRDYSIICQKIRLISLFKELRWPYTAGIYLSRTPLGLEFLVGRGGLELPVTPSEKVGYPPGFA